MHIIVGMSLKEFRRLCYHMRDVNAVNRINDVGRKIYWYVGLIGRVLRRRLLGKIMVKAWCGIWDMIDAVLVVDLIMV